jgi:tetratricopeptide (TPR) repeat protein
MKRTIVALVLALNVATGWRAVAGDDPPKKLTPEERKELEAKWIGLMDLGVKQANAGEIGAAEETFQKALQTGRQVYPNQDNIDLAQLMVGLAAVLSVQGNHADAEQLAREAADMHRRLYPKKDNEFVAISLMVLGAILTDRGKYAEAEAQCREAVEMNRRLYPKRGHDSLAVSLNTLADVLKHQGKFADAEKLFREALEMNRGLYPNQDHHFVAESMNLVAGVLQDQEKYKDAQALYEEAVEMFRRLYPKRDHARLAVTLSNLAGVLHEQRQYANAEPLAREALEMNRRLHPKPHPDLVLSLNNLGSVLGELGKYDDAESLLREMLEMKRGLYPKQGHPDLARGLNNLALLLGKRQKYQDAEPLFRQALRMQLALVRDYAMERSEGDSLTLVAKGAMGCSDFLSNAQAMKADRAGVYPEVMDSKGVIARVYEQRAMVARAASDPKSAGLLDKVIDRRRRRADLLLVPTPTDPMTRKQRDADLAQYAKEIEGLDRELRSALPAVDRSEKLAKATPPDLQKVLPADAAVVDYLRWTHFEQDPKKPGAEGEKLTVKYLAFVVTKEKVSWIDLKEADPIEKAVTAWRNAITAGKDIPPEMAKKVRELVWDKVRKELPDKVKVVYISPDSALCRVPWAALPGDKPGTIVLEDYAIATIPHALFLLDKLWAQDAVAKRPTDVLAVGGVAYDAGPLVPGPMPADRNGPVLKPDQKLHWAELPGAAAEVQGVSATAKKKELTCRTIDGDRATTSVVLAALPKVRYAHLATHGFFADPSFQSAFHVDPKLFERSLRGERVGAGALSPMVMTGLVFAGANKPNTPGRGVLTGEALVDVNLSGLELAVLSACETGLGDVAGGEGTFGLQRAFHLAGTRDVVASLWKVRPRR